jgi:transposase
MPRLSTAERLVPDALWAVVEPLLPRYRASPKGGRPRVPDRAALAGIIYVLRSGAAWRLLPPELGCGSGVTCWRRLDAWQRRGVWQRLHHVLLRQLDDAERIDWSRAALDARSLPAKKGDTPSAVTARTKANRARSTTS